MENQENDDDRQREKKEARESGKDFRFHRRELLRGTAEKRTVAQIHTRELFAIIGEAGKLYRTGKRAAAAKMLGWVDGTGKRGPTEDHHSIVATYLLQVGMGVEKVDAVTNLVRIFKLTSWQAALKILQHNKKRLPTIPLPKNY
jgi:hypothetical protein